MPVLVVHRFLVSSLAAVLVTGCIPNPARNTTPTGDPLRVRFDTESGSYREQQVVGQDTYYDSNGNAAGSVERTEMVTKHYQHTSVGFFQGTAEVDEQDYFHLARDPGAVDEIKDARARMSRDLTIGVPLALLGAAAGTLFAVGTFGDSPAIKSGGSIGMSVASIGGAMLALRGFKTLHKKPLLDPSRAIAHAAVVEECYSGRCRTRPGGAASVTPTRAPTSLAMRARPRPTGRAAWVGTWTGTGKTMIETPDGRRPRTSSIEVGIGEGPDGSLIVTLEPRDPQRCQLQAKVTGDRAELDRDQICNHHEGNRSLSMTVHDGTLSLHDGSLELALAVELHTVERGGRRAPRFRTLVGSMRATATRAP